ncbi:MAG: DUF6279 family lipoprotein [Gammaproteobacteria bacterium]|nr:DUF6279 family lipoprotein [Gammaproteobacteria bacterium]
MKRSRALWMAILAVLTLQGCGMKLVYNNLDRIVPWYVDSYIDLTPEQRRYLKLRMKEHLYWHRTTQLMAYVSTLEGVANAMQDGLEREELEGLIGAVKVHRNQLLDQIMPTASVLFASSSDAQLLQFAIRLDEENEEYLEKGTRDRAKLEAEWSKDVQKSLKGLVGRLTPAQKLLIDERSHAAQFEAPAYVAFQRNWQRDFLRALAKRDDPIAFAERFAYMAHHYEEWFTDEYREIEKRDDEFYRALALEVDRLLTAEQRRKLMDWFLKLAGTLSELAADAKDQAPAVACIVEAPLEDICSLHMRVASAGDNPSAR